MENTAVTTPDKSHKPKKVFVEGPISPAFIADSIAKHSTKTGIGGHSIFLGQVRKDVIGDQSVAAIEYTAYTEMAEEKLHEIREAIFDKYPLTCMHIYHSLGMVPAGEICLFVFTSAPHRKEAIDACTEIVERIKKEAPIWGKEILGDETYVWKKTVDGHNVSTMPSPA
jgi:molybdopterin synthase catalytic subunit